MTKLELYFYCWPPSFKVQKIIEEQTVGQTDIDLYQKKNKDSFRLRNRVFVSAKFEKSPHPPSYRITPRLKTSTMNALRLM